MFVSPTMQTVVKLLDVLNDKNAVPDEFRISNTPMGPQGRQILIHLSEANEEVTDALVECASQAGLTASRLDGASGVEIPLNDSHY